MTATAVLLAAGSSERFGREKLEVQIGGKPAWLVSFEALNDHPEIDSVGVVANSAIFEDVKRLAPGAVFVVKGTLPVALRPDCLRYRRHRKNCQCCPTHCLAPTFDV